MHKICWPTITLCQMMGEYLPKRRQHKQTGSRQHKTVLSEHSTTYIKMFASLITSTIVYIRLIQKARSHYPGRLAAKSQSLYVADHLIESQGTVCIACSPEGFTRFQLVWHNVAE